MGLLKLDKNKIMDSYGNLEKACNTSVGEAFDSLAGALVSHAGESALMDELIDNCKTVQSMYNDSYLPALRGALDAFRETYDLAEYDATKASVGDVDRRDVGATMEKIDASSVVI